MELKYGDREYKLDFHAMDSVMAKTHPHFTH